MQKKLLIIAILMALAMAALNIFYEEPVNADIVCPMANQNIEWYYAGK